MQFFQKQSSIPLVLSSLLSIEMANSFITQTHGFVLDNNNIPKTVRKYCTPEILNNNKTPIQESIERGNCESFTKAVGLISTELLTINPGEKGEETPEPKNMRANPTYTSGTATLISPTVILTAAHVVDKCRDGSRSCAFILSGANEGDETPFKDIYLPKEYEEFRALEKRLEDLKNSEEYDIFIKTKEKLEDTIKQKINSLRTQLEQVSKMSQLTTRKTKENEEGENEDEEITQLKTDIEISEEKTKILSEESEKLAQEIKRMENLALVSEYIKTDKIIKEKRKADISDIALVRLKYTPYNYSIHLPIQYDPINIPESKTQSFFGVSDNRIRDNTTGNIIDEMYQRHIAIFNFKREDQTGANLTSILTIPDDYVSGRCELDGLGKLIKYPTRFQYDPSVFLMGALQPGDSGGPLITKIGGLYKIIGVARLIDYAKCTDLIADQLLPGKPYKNEWTPVSAHKEWIEATLQHIRENS